MAQFDVYRNPEPSTAAEVPFLLDIQNDLLSGLATRVVVPLFAEAAMPRPAMTLNPVFEVSGQRVVMSTAELAGVRLGAIGEHVVSLVGRRDDIVRAIDVIISGV